VALEKPYPANWKKSTIVKRLKAAVVIDPYLISAHQFLQSFDTKDQADEWLSGMAALDDDGYCGCVVMDKDHAINQYG
jgi:hypothetical protein